MSIFINRDVQLLVACCVADILRIFAPEAPYKTAEQIKTIFYFLIKQLGGLRDPKDPAFKRLVTSPTIRTCQILNFYLTNPKDQSMRA